MSNHILPHVCDNENHLAKLDQAHFDLHQIENLLSVLNLHTHRVLESLSFSPKEIDPLKSVEQISVFLEVLLSIAEKSLSRD